jgi:MG2 domain-containing protein
VNQSHIAKIWLISLFIIGTIALSLYATSSSASAQADQAAEQANNNSGSEQSAEAMTTYKPAYPTARADSMNSLTFETDKHLYKPGEHVSIEGSILTSVLADLGDVSFVVLEVTDNKGHIVAEDESDFDSDGMFEMAFTLPEDSELGAHTVKATVEADAELLGTLDASIQAQLSKSVKFAVVSPVAFAVKAEDKDFEVNVASNSSEVRDFAFEQAEKKIEFTVEGETGTRGVAQVTLPRELLAGEMTVSIDGRVIAEDSNDVIVTSDTATEMTLEINYPHSEHTIEIVGTSVVPEFPISMLVMVGALGSVVAAVTIASRSKFAHRI